jgi:hypothetical protein
MIPSKKSGEKRPQICGNKRRTKGPKRSSEKGKNQLGNRKIGTRFGG